MDADDPILGDGQPWEEQPDATEYSLVLPFLDDSPSFTHGFEVGWNYGRMKHGREPAFQQTVHTENQRQLMMAAKEAGWTIRFEPLNDDFTEMFAEASRG